MPPVALPVVVTAVFAVTLVALIVELFLSSAAAVTVSLQVASLPFAVVALTVYVPVLFAVNTPYFAVLTPNRLHTTLLRCLYSCLDKESL